MAERVVRWLRLGRCCRRCHRHSRHAHRQSRCLDALPNVRVVDLDAVVDDRRVRAPGHPAHRHAVRHAQLALVPRAKHRALGVGRRVQRAPLAVDAAVRRGEVKHRRVALQQRRDKEALVQPDPVRRGIHQRLPRRRRRVDALAILVALAASRPRPLLLDEGGVGVRRAVEDGGIVVNAVRLPKGPLRLLRGAVFDAHNLEDLVVGLLEHLPRQVLRRDTVPSVEHRPKRRAQHALGLARHGGGIGAVDGRPGKRRRRGARLRLGEGRRHGAWVVCAQAVEAVETVKVVQVGVRERLQKDCAVARSHPESGGVQVVRNRQVEVVEVRVHGRRCGRARAVVYR